MLDILSTEEAATRLGCSRQRIHALIKAGRLPAQRVGRTFAIRPADLDSLTFRTGGWPRGKPRPHRESKME